MELKKYKKLDAITLKYLAMFMMLLDHLWATIVPGNDWMNYIGRLAFPIFAFQIVEGYFHTKDYKQYLKRLFIFALISEIPFNLMTSGSYIYPFGQNVIFTFIYGIVSIHAIEEIIKRNHVVKNVVKVLLMMILSIITFPDYNLMGYLTVLLFYVTRNMQYAWLYQLVGMIYLNWYSFKGLTIYVEAFGKTIPVLVQSFAVLSLLLIWQYNGKPGNQNPILRKFAYWFYPLHMLVIYLISRII